MSTQQQSGWKPLSKPKTHKTSSGTTLLTPILSTCSMRVFPLRVPGSVGMTGWHLYCMQPEKPNQDLPIPTPQKRRKWLKSCSLVASQDQPYCNRGKKILVPPCPHFYPTSKNPVEESEVIFISMICRYWEMGIVVSFFQYHLGFQMCGVFPIPTTNSLTPTVCPTIQFNSILTLSLTGSADPTG